MIAAEGLFGGSIVYGLWSGYFRCDDASFMGLNRQTGWRGGHRFLREFGHGAYLVWNLGTGQGIHTAQTLLSIAGGAS